METKRAREVEETAAVTVKKARVDVKTMFVGKADPKYRVGCDAWGNSFSLRKSDMQKAIRRGLVEQALVAFHSMFSLAIIFPGNPNGKREQTNIINRIAVCAMEDVGVANVPLVMWAVRVCFGMTMYGEERKPFLLERIIVALCHSKKTRVMSWMAHAYGHKNRALAYKFGIEPPLSIEADPLLTNPQWYNVAETDPLAVWRVLGVDPAAKPKSRPMLYNIWTKIAQRNRPAVIRFALSVKHFKIKFSPLSANTAPVQEKWLHADFDNVEDIRLNLIDKPPQECANDMHVRKAKTREEKIKFRTEGSYVDNEEKSYDPVGVLKQIYAESNF